MLPQGPRMTRYAARRTSGRHGVASVAARLRRALPRRLPLPRVRRTRSGDASHEVARDATCARGGCSSSHPLLRRAALADGAGGGAHTVLEGAELHTLELLCADLALTLPSLPAGAPRTYHVRWSDCARSAHARATHEQLNINLTRRIDCLEGNAMQPREGRHGGRRPAEQFEGTTLDPK